MDYLDFEVRIGTRAGESYPITVVQSPFDKPGATLVLPLADPIFKEHLQTVEQTRSAVAATRRATGSSRQSHQAGASLTTEPDVMREIGRQLFDALFPKTIYSCYRQSREHAKREGKRLRLRLHLDAPELALLPWEFLFDAAEGDHLAPNEETPLTRYIALERAIESLTVAPPLRILGMIAAPQNQQMLDVAQEKKTVEALLSGLVESRMVELDWVPGQTVRDLDRKLREQAWHILHFIGHASFDEQRGEGYIVLADSNGNSHFLSAIELGAVLSRCPTLRLVVLNACEGARASEHNLFSSTGAALLQRGIPAVISMQYNITDLAAVDFAQNFYDALARHLPVDAAVTEARYWLRLNPEVATEWGTPVLYMRAPDGNLFDLAETQTLFFQQQSAPKPWPKSTPAPAPVPAQTTETNRGLQILRRRVQQFWIEGVLEHSLFQQVLIDLGMTQDFAAVENIWLERPNAVSRPLPPEQRIADIFAEEGSSLLILGEPGSGKTTTLLGMARDLLTSSEQDPSYPIPTIFNLSSWVEPQRTISDWLADELSAKYQVPKRIGRGWLQEGRLLPFLDGLDELQAKHRVSCVEAINVFAQEMARSGVVVCCRLREYTELPVRLALNAAVRLQPLTDAQVQGYLERAGEPLAALQAALQRDSALRIDARSPLMLNLMARAYQGLSADDVLQEGIETTALRRKNLMDAYVVRMLRQAGVR